MTKMLDRETQQVTQQVTEATENILIALDGPEVRPEDEQEEQQRAEAVMKTAEKMQHAAQKLKQHAAQKLKQRAPALQEEQTMEQKKTERFSVTLVSKAINDLESLKNMTGMSKTDIVNRAISIYEFIETQTRSQEYDLLLRRRSDGTTQYVRFL